MKAKKVPPPVPLGEQERPTEPTHERWCAVVVIAHGNCDCGRLDDDGEEVDREIDPRVTPTQHQVFELLAEGKTRKQIAEEMDVSWYSVRNWVSDGYQRLGLQGDDAHVVNALLELGLIVRR